VNGYASVIDCLGVTGYTGVNGCVGVNGYASVIDCLGVTGYTGVNGCGGVIRCAGVIDSRRVTQYTGVNGYVWLNGCIWVIGCEVIQRPCCLCALSLVILTVVRRCIFAGVAIGW
jgi:hypothetical protein